MTIIYEERHQVLNCVFQKISHTLRRRESEARMGVLGGESRDVWRERKFFVKQCGGTQVFAGGEWVRNMWIR